jgi:hypothetical protein
MGSQTLKNMIYKCPNCKGELTVVPGQRYDPTDGVTIYCKNPRPNCSMDDWAHGKNAKEAFNIFEYKCGKKDDDKSRKAAAKESDD